MCAVVLPRWLIGRFHYVLRSGTKIEELQLRSAESLQRAIMVYSMAAFRVMQLSMKLCFTQIFIVHQFIDTGCGAELLIAPPHRFQSGRSISFSSQMPTQFAYPHHRLL